MTQIDVSKVAVHAAISPSNEVQLSKLVVHAVVGEPSIIKLSKLIVHVVVNKDQIEVSKIVGNSVTQPDLQKTHVSKIIVQVALVSPDVFACIPSYLTQEHIDDAQLLTADGVVDLFEITLTDETQLFLKANNAVIWQGNTYEATAIQLDGVANFSDAETARPKLTVANPEGVFSALVSAGVLDNANVIRRRVLYQNMLIDVPISETQTWRVRRIVSMNREKIVMELRDRTDSQFFLTPGRMFIPPDFPQVSLS